MNKSNKKIGIIGAGNLASSIIKGLINTCPSISKYISIVDKDPKRVDFLEKEFNVNTNNSIVELAKECDIIILAIKPDVYNIVLQEISTVTKPQQIIVSMAAGISIQYIEEFYCRPVKIVRAMTNTSVLVGEGMTVLSPNQQVDYNELKNIVGIFQSVGRVDVIDQKLLDATTSISASSPAFVYMFIEALADGGVLEGLPREKAYEYAAQGVLGAAKMVLETKKHPGQLKDMVCSPGGMTMEALFTLERNNFRGSIIEAVKNCTAKSKELINK